MSAAARRGEAAALAGAAGTGGSTAAPAFRPAWPTRIENLSAPIACLRCGQVRPPARWVAVAPHAACLASTAMAPVCAACIPPSAPDERPLSHV